MSTKVLQIIALLDSDDFETKANAIVVIKNSIIGNRRRKNEYVENGIIPKLIKMLQDESDPNILIQTYTSLGSLAYGESKATDSLLGSNIISILSESLRNENLSIVESAIRTLKIIYKSENGLTKVSLTDDVILHIIQLIKCQFGTINRSATEIIGLSCRQSLLRQRLVAENGGLESLLSLLYCSPTDSNVEVTSEALAWIIWQNPKIAHQILQLSSDLPMKLFGLLRKSRGVCRLSICNCLTTMNSVGVIQDQGSVRLLLLSSLVNMCDSSIAHIRITAPIILARLITNDSSLQKSASELNVIDKLTETFESPNEQISTSDTRKVQESSFLALAAVCSKQEDCRRKVLQANILPHLISGLKSNHSGLRKSACECCTSLTRSVKNLRTSMVQAEMADLLSKLLNDEDVEVQIAACGALCNVVLDFCPMKQSIIDNGGLKQLVSLLSHSNANLKLNSAWALKNLLYLAPKTIQDEVIHTLTWDGLLNLLENSNEQVQEQGLQIIRNLSYGGFDEGIESIDKLVTGCGGRLKTILSTILLSSPNNLVRDALYICSNISSGTISHRNFIASTGTILQEIKNKLESDDPNVRVAAVWCVINLSWLDGSGLVVEILRNAGIHLQLRKMVDDVDLDVRERVQTALVNLQVPLF